MKGLGLVVLAACGLVQTQSSSPPSSPTVHDEARPAPEADGALVVPDLIGLSFDDASAAVARAGFRQPLERGQSVPCAATAHAANGAVKCQAPAAGEHARANMLVMVQVEHVVASTIPTRDELVKIMHLTPDEAKQYLDGLGWHGTIVPSADYHFELDAKCRPGVICGFQGEFSEERLIIYVMPN